jgi:hypothetical protein
MVGSQPGQIVHETPISKITSAKYTGGVAQEVECLICKVPALQVQSPEFKLQSYQKIVLKKEMVHV